MANPDREQAAGTDIRFEGDAVVYRLVVRPGAWRSRARPQLMLRIRCRDDGEVLVGLGRVESHDHIQDGS